MSGGRIVAEQAHLLPNDPEAEAAVAGALLIDPDTIMRVQETGLRPEDFYTRKWGWVFEAAEDLALHGEPIDFISVAHKLENIKEVEGNRLELIGGEAALIHLIASTASAVHASYYSKLIIRDARKRQLIAAGAAISAKAHSFDGDLGELYDAVSKTLFESMERSDVDSHLYGGPEAMARYRQNQRDRAERLKMDPNALIKTHWPDVDRLIGDFQGGQLVIVAASTSVGKTMAMEQIAEANAKRGHVIAFYHLELSHQSMQDRCVARYSGIDTRRLREGWLTPDVERALDAIEPWYRNITLVQCPGWSAERIAADIARLHARGHCELAIVDYLQKIPTPIIRGGNYAQGVGQNVETLKTMAQNLDIPLVLGSQVNREYNARGNRRPTISDLRDSGEIEEKSNIVLMLHNPVAREDRNEDDPTETIELYIEKSTDGPLGKVDLEHIKGRFLLASPVLENVDIDDVMAQQTERIPF